MNNTQTAHSFIYGDTARGNNFTTDGITLYSYFSILARKYKGLILVSNNIATYSNSSCKHMAHLNNAVISYDDLVTIYTHDLGDMLTFDINKEVSHVIDMIKQLLIKQSKARVTDYFWSIEKHITELTKLMKIFKVDKRTTHYKEYLIYSDIDTLKEGYKDIISNYAELEKKRKKQAQEKAYKRKLEKLESFTGVSMKQYSISEITTYDFLVIKEDTLCTSQHLCVNLNEAKLLYLMLIRGKDIIGRKIGHYTIISHNKKYVKIGCHNILITELKRVLA